MYFITVSALVWCGRLPAAEVAAAGAAKNGITIGGG
jgi:hypothetical protein